MEFRRYDPIPQLAHAVECVWTLEVSQRGMPTLSPSFRMEGRNSSFHLGDGFDVVDEAGRAERQPPLLFAGQLESRLLLHPTGRIAVVGVRFHPFGAASLLPLPQNQVTGSPSSLDVIHPALARCMTAIRDSTDDPDVAAAALQNALLAWLQPSRIDRRIRAAVMMIDGTCGRIPIDRLAVETGMTRRHLERRFLDAVGVTPKRLARIARFQRALCVLERADSARRSTETAVACGYADQSHFIRDFRALAGCSPTRHLLRQAELTGFFVSPDA
ncbi:MAG: helix-turn-helix domain-containing protein [Gemmatimonadetes bacterium]|nr:helix-turn-helix domain-containing protein [Gemmatimonadota bacterium]